MNKMNKRVNNLIKLCASFMTHNDDRGFKKELLSTLPPHESIIKECLMQMIDDENNKVVKILIEIFLDEEPQCIDNCFMYSLKNNKLSIAKIFVYYYNYHSYDIHALVSRCIQVIITNQYTDLFVYLHKKKLIAIDNSLYETMFRHNSIKILKYLFDVENFTVNYTYMYYSFKYNFSETIKYFLPHFKYSNEKKYTDLLHVSISNQNIPLSKLYLNEFFIKNKNYNAIDIAIGYCIIYDIQSLFYDLIDMNITPPNYNFTIHSLSMCNSSSSEKYILKLIQNKKFKKKIVALFYESIECNNSYIVNYILKHKLINTTPLTYNTENNISAFSYIIRENYIEILRLYIDYDINIDIFICDILPYLCIYDYDEIFYDLVNKYNNTIKNDKDLLNKCCRILCNTKNFDSFKFIIDNFDITPTETMLMIAIKKSCYPFVELIMNKNIKLVYIRDIMTCATENINEHIIKLLYADENISFAWMLWVSNVIYISLKSYFNLKSIKNKTDEQSNELKLHIFNIIYCLEFFTDIVPVPKEEYCSYNNEECFCFDDAKNKYIEENYAFQCMKCKKTTHFFCALEWFTIQNNSYNGKKLVRHLFNSCPFCRNNIDMIKDGIFKENTYRILTYI